MNFKTKTIGWDYRAVLKRKCRGNYQLRFPGNIVASNRKFLDEPRFYAEIYRPSGLPRDWDVNFFRITGAHVDRKIRFTSLMEAAYFARKHMMEWEGVCDEPRIEDVLYD